MLNPAQSVSHSDRLHGIRSEIISIKDNVEYSISAAKLNVAGESVTERQQSGLSR